MFATVFFSLSLKCLSKQSSGFQVVCLYHIFVEGTFPQSDLFQLFFLFIFFLLVFFCLFGRSAICSILSSFSNISYWTLLLICSVPENVLQLFWGKASCSFFLFHLSNWWHLILASFDICNFLLVFFISTSNSAILYFY